jgi:putative spermidine/putrescine transport system substrate-binding protein
MAGRGNGTRDIDRRQFNRLVLGGIAGAALGGAVGACGGEAASSTQAAGPLTVVSYGGSFNTAFQQTLIDPFEAATGIDVSLVEGTSLQGLKLQVSARKVTWDVPALSGAEYLTAVSQGLLEPYAPGKVDLAKVPKRFQGTHGSRFGLFLFVMAWDQRKIPDSSAPRTWAEFFDTRKYPGKRSLYENLTDGAVLEAALMADGVPLEAIYPLDVDRALRVLEQRLGKGNIIWHRTNQEPIQQLTSGEVALATSFNGRVRLARANEKAPLGFTASQAVIGGDYLVVPKGATHQDSAWKFINFVYTNDVAGAAFTRATGYPTANSGIEKHLSAEERAQLPTSPELADRTVLKGDEWWSANLGPATETFKRWQQS